MPNESQKASDICKGRRLFFTSASFLRPRREKRILELAGYAPRFGIPSAHDYVAIWGEGKTAKRGHRLKNRFGAKPLFMEDAFLRSLFPGRSGAPPIGLLLDKAGLHYDAEKPSDLERILKTHPLSDAELLARAKSCMERLKEAHLSKYTAFDPSISPPKPGYILVIDQSFNDASVRASGDGNALFSKMLEAACSEHPGKTILIKTHPETNQGFRGGYFDTAKLPGDIKICDQPISPWHLLENAASVYTVSSGMGFEAILAGHRPIVFGTPFYAGWNLSDDRQPIAERGRILSREQLFAAAMILYPYWYDVFQDRLCTLERAIDILEAETRSWREDHRGWRAQGIRLWKRKHMQQFFGRYMPVDFSDKKQSPQADAKPMMIWASKALSNHASLRVEDGFLRSRGLGAQLTPPLSLALDDLGIYYDPSHPSRLETLISARRVLRPDQQARAQALIEQIKTARLSKYNLTGAVPNLPQGRKILVIGQVEDDASIQKGAGHIRTNSALLTAARREEKNSVILYKPHPDVESGLRSGKISNPQDADLILDNSDIAELFERVDAVWTMTSLTGFEALLRGLPVIVTGAPFYAGWGLTRDLGTPPDRRQGPLSLESLVHASLIDYPRYLDPVTHLPCPVEIAVERLAGENKLPKPIRLKFLAKLQGAMASRSFLWRR